jgi:hypothetical protein
VSFNLPFGIGGVEWEPDRTEREAAWSLYVELVTRIAVQPLEEGRGLLREALTSLYSLFASTREILRAAGPNVGIRPESVGGIAISVLNNGLRPILSRWHPELQVWENKCPSDVSPKEHEEQWADSPSLRSELEALREDLSRYADALAEIAGVKK